MSASRMTSRESDVAYKVYKIFEAKSYIAYFILRVIYNRL